MIFFKLAKEIAMQSTRGFRRTCTVLSVALLATFCVTDLAMAKGKKRQARAPQQNTEQGIYSSIVQVAPKKGYIMVTKDNNVMWVQASAAAKPHVKDLPVGEMIDIVVEMRGAKKPPLMKSWKLVSGESRCKNFNGKKCYR